MLRREIDINCSKGMDSKLAAMLIQKASRYQSNLWIEKGNKHANAKSLLGILSLGLKEGDFIVLCAEGEDEKSAVSELESFLKSMRIDGETYE